MKKSRLIITTLGSCFVFSCIHNIQNAYSYSSGAPVEFGNRGYTGSNRDYSRTCATIGCHNQNGVIDGNQFVETTFGSRTILPLDTVVFHVSADQNGMFNVGFMATIENETGESIGEFILDDTTLTQIVGQRNYVTHKRQGYLKNEGYTFRWIAPNNVMKFDQVRFYASLNLSNGDGTPSGDQIAKVSINTQQRSESDFIRISQNQTARYLEIRLLNDVNSTANLFVTNTRGEVISSSQIPENYVAGQPIQISTRTWSNGLYLVCLHEESLFECSKLIVH